VPFGAALSALTLVVFALSDSGTPIALLAVTTLLSGIGLGFVGAPTFSSVYRVVQPEEVSRATSAMFILNQLGASLGIAIMALILQRATSGGSVNDAFAIAFWWSVGGSTVIVIASQLLPGKDPVATLPAGGSVQHGVTMAD
jgi:hypothetical protein